MIWESLSQMLGAKIKLTAPYYPQGNAVIERSHRTQQYVKDYAVGEKRERLELFITLGNAIHE